MISLTNEEELLVKLGAQRYEHKLAQLKENNLLALTGVGSRIIHSGLKPVAENIEHYRKSVKEDCLLESEQLAFVGLSIVINHLEPDMKFSSLCFKVGTAVVEEYNAQLINLPEGLNRNQIITRIRKHKPTRIKKSQRLRIGALVISAVEARTPLIDFHYKIINNRKYRVVSPSEKFLQGYNDFLRDKVYSKPLRKPIQSFPVPFDNNLIGGYAFDVLNNYSALKHRNKKQLEVIQTKGDMEMVKNTLNKIQSIPYEINKEVFDVAWSLYTNDKPVAGLPPQVMDAPDKLSKDATEEERLTHIKRASQIREYNNSVIGKRFNVARTLMVAQECSDFDHFYFPCYLDFRGRTYYHGDYLNPQGTDLSKALLAFKSGKVIEEDFFYFVHGANCFGKDKLSYLDRYKFIESYKDSILSIAKDPIKHLDLWKDADSPFEFLAFCFDCAKYLADPKNHLSKLRIASDASASGLQILSLLLRDKEGCTRTNVLEGDAEKPSDVYLECAAILQELLKKDAQSGLQPVSAHAKYWQTMFTKGDIRSLVKRILMTSVYSLSSYGLRGYVNEWILDTRGIISEDMFDHDSYLTKRVTEAVKDTVKGASIGMEYIKSAAKKLAKEEQDLEITLPNGFVLMSSYRKFNDKKIKLRTQKGTVYINYKDAGDKVQKGKSVNASVPNYIHSLDASILHNVVQKISNAIPFSLVHDSVYYRAGDADTFYEQIRQSVSSLFQEDLLEDFKSQVEDKLKYSSLDAKPSLGTIDFAEVKEAPYIYH